MAKKNGLWAELLAQPLLCTAWRSKLGLEATYNPQWDFLRKWQMSFVLLTCTATFSLLPLKVKNF